MGKYVTVEISGIITTIGKEIKPNYTEGLIEVFLPDETKMTAKQEQEWTKENNKRMKAICKFLNDNNL